jgi:hypothetical protein
MSLLRRTEALGALALATAGGLCAVELRHVWRRGSAREAAHAGHYRQAGRAATRETIAVVREGYHAAPPRENTVFNMLVAFLTTFGATRGVTHMIRAGSGPFRNLAIGRWRIHHFVPGILIAFLAGGVSIGLRHEELDKWLALPFGSGVALVLDETALLLELDDVYWSEEGIVSVQAALAATALLASLGLAVRLVRRGEPYVLSAPDATIVRPTSGADRVPLTS